MAACAEIVAEPSDPLTPREDNVDSSVETPRLPIHYELLSDYDRDGDGVLDAVELGPDHDRELARIDSSGDGRLDWQEFRPFATEGYTNVVFDDWDVDRDGFVDREELGAGRFERLDRDATDTIDSQEWEWRYSLPLDQEHHPGFGGD